jgi:hypothetical protein
MSGTQPGTNPEPGEPRTANGKTPRKARSGGNKKTAVKKKGAKKASPSRIDPTPERAAQMKARALSATQPNVMDALFQSLPLPGGEIPWTEQQNIAFLEAVASSTKFVYGLKGSITITAKAA